MCESMNLVCFLELLPAVKTLHSMIEQCGIDSFGLTAVDIVCCTHILTVWQAHGVELGLAGTVVVACTATLAAIGAAAIPSAGLVTMLMVLQVNPGGLSSCPHW